MRISCTPHRLVKENVFKAVLLFNGNKVASVPVEYSVQMAENYNNMEYLLMVLKSKDHNWKISVGLKVI